MSPVRVISRYDATYGTIHEVGRERRREPVECDRRPERPVLDPPAHLLLIARCRVGLPMFVVRGREQVFLRDGGDDELVRRDVRISARPDGEGLVHVDGDGVGVVGVEDDGGKDGLALGVLVCLRPRETRGRSLDLDQDGDIDAVGKNPMFVRDEKLQYPGRDTIRRRRRHRQLTHRAAFLPRPSQ